LTTRSGRRKRGAMPRCPSQPSIFDERSVQAFVYPNRPRFPPVSPSQLSAMYRTISLKASVEIAK